MSDLGPRQPSDSPDPDKQAFREYCKLSVKDSFSQKHLETLTFHQVMSLKLPRILPARSAVFKHWSEKIPIHDDSTTLPLDGSQEVVPAYSDLKSTLEIDKLFSAFKKGARSVVIDVSTNGNVKWQWLHFRKVRLLQDLCQSYERCTLAQRLVTLLLELKSKPRTPRYVQEAIDFFLSCRIFDPLCGFLSTHGQLAWLGTLTDEDWVDEEIFNAMAETSYFRQYLLSPTLTPTPLNKLTRSLLFLPTYFLHHVWYSLGDEAGESSVTTLNVAGIRQRLIAPPQGEDVDGMAFFNLDGTHYTAYIYETSDTTLHYADSLGHPPSDEVIETFNTLLDHIGLQAVTSIKTHTVARQGIREGGYGSCGIAALNFAQTYSSSVYKPWAGSNSASFRLSGLCDLLVIHHLASKTSGTVEDWVEECNLDPSSALQGKSDFVFDYGDFNLYKPKSMHPIYTLGLPNSGIYEDGARQTQRPTAPFKSRLPFLLNLPSEPLSPPLQLQGPSTTPHPTTPTRPPSAAGKRKGQEVLTPSSATRPTKHKRVVSKISGQSSDNSIEIVAEWEDGPKSQPKPERWGQPPTLPPIWLLSPFELGGGVSSKPPTVKPESSTQAQNEPHRGVAMVIDLTLSATPSPAAGPVKMGTKLGDGTSRGSLNNAERHVKSEPEMIDLSGSPEAPASKGEQQDAPKPTSRTPSSVTASSNAELVVGMVFVSAEEGQQAVIKSEERRGFQWKIGFSYGEAYGQRKKYTMTCNRSREHEFKHSEDVDPREWRQGNTIKAKCSARVNINRMGNTGLWHITSLSLEHNHGPQVDVGGSFRKPATVEQKTIIKRLATSKTQKFKRGQIIDVLEASGEAGEEPLEPRQVTSLMAQYRKGERGTVGGGIGLGDCQAIIDDLGQKGDGWVWHVKLDNQGRLVGLWWASPRQVQLLRRYGDILINDNTYNRNMYGFALGIAIVVDGQGCSRSVWYCLMETENLEMHCWALRNSLAASGNRCPDVFILDRDRALISAVKEVLVFAFHVYCLHHLMGNVDKNLARLAKPWPDFLVDFWRTFRAVSPQIFDHLWMTICTKYPDAARYLNENLYECREHWAWAWISHLLTAGIRTNGRVESENRITTNFSGPKSTGFQVYSALNERAVEQEKKEKRQTRDSSRRHPHAIEGVFPAVMAVLREHLELFAFQKCYVQMQECVYYTVEVIQKPSGIRTWDEYAVSVRDEPGWEWSSDEATRSFNDFTNDSAYLATPWLLRLIQDCGLTVEHLLKVLRLKDGVSTVHVLALLAGGGFVCDCTMPMNMGIPCRHFFAVLKKNPNLKLSIDMINRRWYKDPTLNVNTVPRVSAVEAIPSTHPDPVGGVPGVSLANPLQSQRFNVTPAPTQTLPARDVMSEAHAAIRPILNHIQTQGELDSFLDAVHEYQ